MNPLAKLSFPSSQRLSARLEHQQKRQSTVTISDSDSDIEEIFAFGGIAALSLTYHDACTTEMVRAYDQLVEIDESLWLREIKQHYKGATPEDQLHHYRIYLDNGPCFDFICETYKHQKNG
jgi:hypothetical protein